jgi:hypothetical protein
MELIYFLWIPRSVSTLFVVHWNLFDIIVKIRYRIRHLMITLLNCNMLHIIKMNKYFCISSDFINKIHKHHYFEFHSFIEISKVLYHMTYFQKQLASNINAYKIKHFSFLIFPISSYRVHHCQLQSGYNLQLKWNLSRKWQ